MVKKTHNGVGPEARERLSSLVTRIERLDEEKKSIADDIKDIFVEAKSAGFDAKAIRTILRERRQDKAEVEEYLSICELYRNALDAATKGSDL